MATNRPSYLRMDLPPRKPSPPCHFGRYMLLKSPQEAALRSVSISPSCQGPWRLAIASPNAAKGPCWNARSTCGVPHRPYIRKKEKKKKTPVLGEASTGQKPIIRFSFGPLLAAQFFLLREQKQVGVGRDKKWLVEPPRTRSSRDR
jgi:hypothetical protein